MKNYELKISLRRFDDGWAIEAYLPGRDQVKVHKPTKAEMLQYLSDNLPGVIDDLEAAFNPA